MGALKIVVIGAGPAGIMAAGMAAKGGNEVILLDKNDRLGKKLFITGKGRCNVTNSSDIEDMIDNVPGNGNFLYSAFYTFTNENLIEFLNDLGLATKVERGNRVFPESDRASDVIDTLEKFLKLNNVRIQLRAEVKKIYKKNKEFIIEMGNGDHIICDKLIISTGGCTYQGTGSTGDGYRFAKSFGHTIKEPKPSLIPLVTKEDWVKELQGLSLKNAKVTLMKNNKKLYESFGEMLFTHFGVSGPVILSSSRHLVGVDTVKDDVKLIVDLKPALTFEQLDNRITRDFEMFTNKNYVNALDELLPQKMIPVIVSLSGISDIKKVHQITREERQNLVRLLKNLTMTIEKTRPLNEGIITAGGVLTDEINPSTMESKLVEGLYFAGEVIDVDAYTGGFNLQIAFSTGYLAGCNV
ncbi:MAG TPA: aminoacetone oxidase family FAD-binding enzyme [Clostridiales bacterium]|nr:MAG: FAD-dependent oxidoreductase [Clostridiales bacterium GWD2_32_19]HCC07517.1 aminoacetone oxidase family FAD-binding enzyme [Clostridiales bacterium]